MAKKKSPEETAVTSLETILNGSATPETQAATDQSSSSIEHVHPLMEEVESFYVLRAELHRKLSVEIQALELKLAELKKTAASLFPDEYGEPQQDRKAKKPKAKTASRGEKADSTLDQAVSSE